MGLPGKPSGIHGGEVEKYYGRERSAKSPTIAKAMS